MSATDSVESRYTREFSYTHRARVCLLQFELIPTTPDLPYDFGKSYARGGTQMGGYGSGRRWSSKETTDDYRRLDVRWLYRKGWLAPGCVANLRWSSRGVEIAAIREWAESDRITVRYSHQYNGEPWETLEYPIFIERTRCHYGGTRPWFLCPKPGCGRRVAVLYSGKYFYCRHCRQLAYSSQRESPLDRALARAQSLHIRLGGDGCVIDGLPPFKPKGMHKRSYDNLTRRYRRYDLRLQLEEVRRFGCRLG